MELTNQFKKIVGAKHVLTEAGDMAPFLKEWRDKYQGRAAMVLCPQNTDEVSQIMALASQGGVKIVPQGGNTGLVGGQIPFDEVEEVVLSLSRLNKVGVVDPVGNTIRVGAGVTLEELQNRALAVDRLFPLSLASQGSCQVGGNLASNAGGVNVLAYGNMRDLCLGLEVVLADGRIWNGLRALKKDNTGYDLRDLFIGSEGTLGIITAAVLKLFPNPRERATAYVGLQSLEDIGRLYTLAMQKAGGQLTAFEIMPRLGLEFVLTATFLGLMIRWQSHMNGTLCWKFPVLRERVRGIKSWPACLSRALKRALLLMRRCPRRLSSVPPSGRCASACRRRKNRKAAVSNMIFRCRLILFQPS